MKEIGCGRGSINDRVYKLEETAKDLKKEVEKLQAVIENFLAAQKVNAYLVKLDADGRLSNCDELARRALKLEQGFIHMCPATNRRYYRVAAFSQEEAIEKAKAEFRRRNDG